MSNDKMSQKESLGKEIVSLVLVIGGLITAIVCIQRMWGWNAVGLIGAVTAVVLGLRLGVSRTGKE